MTDIGKHPKRLASPSAKRPTVKNKDLDAMIAKAWEAGWWAEKRGNNHVLCYPPDGGQMVTMPSTPSDHRSVPNTRSLFRRSGLPL